jgi:L-threonylcarbamoyladenylate synthase
MECLKIDPIQPEADILGRAARVLRRGGVVVYPTETFYGLGANIFEEAACERIRSLKGRRGNKPLPIIVSAINQLDSVIASRPSWLELMAERFWPGPLSLVLPVRPGLQGPLGRYATVVARVSSHKVARGLASTLGFPLTATSANPSDCPPAETAEEAMGHFDVGVDLILDGGSTPGGQPSTIADLSGTTPRLVRPGPVPWLDIVKVLQEAGR